MVPDGLNISQTHCPIAKTNTLRVLAKPPMSCRVSRTNVSLSLLFFLADEMILKCHQAILPAVDDTSVEDPKPLIPLSELKWPYIPDESAYPDPLKRDDPKTLQLHQYEAIGTNHSPYHSHLLTLNCSHLTRHPKSPQRASQPCKHPFVDRHITRTLSGGSSPTRTWCDRP